MLITGMPHIFEHSIGKSVNMSDDDGASVTFKCKAASYGEIEIFWKKAGSSKLPGSSVTSIIRTEYELTSILKITRMIKHYEGSYYCVANNKNGETFSAKAQLHIHGMYVHCSNPVFIQMYYNKCIFITL